MHLGAGKVFDLGKGNTLDGYLKYFYSHQASDDTTIHIAGADDERGSFDAVNSHRLRIGAHLTHKINEKTASTVVWPTSMSLTVMRERPLTETALQVRASKAAAVCLSLAGR